MKKLITSLSVLLPILVPEVSRAADHVIMISTDGLRPAAIEQLLASGDLPTFKKLQQESVWTHNARTAFASTSTVPNHVSMITSRSVDGTEGHGYATNKDPAPTDTIHATKGSYVASAFDVAHDHGKTTSFHRSKTKLAIIDQSYSALTGAPDATDYDDGTAKIDVTGYDETDDQSAQLVQMFLSDLGSQNIHLAFLHLVDPDRQGHGSHWEEQVYFDAVIRVDHYLSQIIHFVENNEPYAGRTTIIFTADHGGSGKSHSDEGDPENYVIPFYVWGADVSASGNLYAINQATRLDPLTERPDLEAPLQPIRNGDMGNLALDLLGLSAIPGSNINQDQSLLISPSNPPIPELSIRSLATGNIQLQWTGNEESTVQYSTNGATWHNAATGRIRYYIDEAQSAEKKFYQLKVD